MNNQIIDTHVYLWRYNRKEFPWITQSIKALAHDFLFDDLREAKQSVGVKQVVLVQARQSTKETQYLCSIAEKEHEVLGVVGWIDLLDDELENELVKYQQASYKTKLASFRHLVQDEPNENFMCQPKFVQAMKLLNQYQFGYDVLIKRHQFAQFLALLREVGEDPTHCYVLDHMGKPAVDGTKNDFALWKSDIEKVACYPQVHCKISGLLTETVKNRTVTRDFRPYIDTVVDCFGVERIVLGSDWPVCTLKGTYSESLNVAKYLKKGLSQNAWHRITKLNAQRLYGKH